MKKTLYETVRNFLDGMKNSDAVKEQVKGENLVIQFVPTDGEPCCLSVTQSRLSVGKGEKYPATVEEGLYITGSEEAMISLFLGDASLAEAIYDHRIQISGYRKKEPMMVWFSKLLRKGRGLKD
jgi:hypothetical protein